MESLIRNHPYADVMNLNYHKNSTFTPELQFSPFLTKLLLEENNSLTILPKLLFQNMPVLLVLNLSHTNIQSLPPSISKLCSLEEFILQDCSLLIELPPEIGTLKNLKLFDLEGTEIMYLPKEIGNLRSLERLRVSFSTYADDHKERNGIQHIIPRMTILKLNKLKELSISVSPEAEWWELELMEAVMQDLLGLPELKTLKLCLPTDKALQQFLRLERCKVPIYTSLWNYRFMTGYCEELPLSVQLDTEENFLKLEKCVKYMNGEGYNDEIVELISDARALYLRRHWTVEKLSMFYIKKLKYCLLMECNEMQTVIDQEDFCKHKNKSTNYIEEDGLLDSLQYLSINFMKKLQSITKGRIGRNSLSCLRVLALHTCPELTTIFTESLLDNMQILTEIIVEDCPKVNCLVKFEEGTCLRYGPFLPNLRRVSLIHLPELVSVCGGVCIAPELDTLLVFNCMKLDSLSDMEIPKDTKAVMGEIEWWDSLKYGTLAFESVFVQLKRDGSLMDQLAEVTNSLQHFLELEMLPLLHGQVNQNSSTDTKDDMEHVDQPDNKDANCNLKAQNHKLPCTKKKNRSTDIVTWIQKVKENPKDEKKYLQNASINSKYQSSISTDTSSHRVKVNKRVEDEKPLDDGYSWRKYGQKEILGSNFPRSYYRCCFRHTHGCSATKQVQRSDEDPSVFEVTYSGTHTCDTDLSNNFSSTANESACITLTSIDSSIATESASTITESYFELPKIPQVLDSNKSAKKSVHRSDEDPSFFEVSYRGKHTCPTDLSNSFSSTATESASTITESHFELPKIPRVLDSDKSKRISSMDAKRTMLQKVSLNTGFDMPPDDGYVWKKYGQHDKIGATYPKHYYRCNSCDAKKLVQRSDDDPSMWMVTYIGIHTCNCLSARDFTCKSESYISILKSSCSSTAAESTSTVTDNSSGHNYTNKMNGGASIQRWKQQPEEIQSPLIYRIPKSYEPNMFISEIEENDSRNLSKPPVNANPLPELKVRKEKLGDRITTLHQLVSPFGKADTASVLEETCGYIKFLHEQVKVLSTPFAPKQLALKKDLRNKGLCLVPVSSTFPVTNFSSPTFVESPDETNAYKAELFPHLSML